MQKTPKAPKYIRTEEIEQELARIREVETKLNALVTEVETKLDTFSATLDKMVADLNAFMSAEQQRGTDIKNILDSE